MTGRLGISHLYSGYHDLDGRANGVPEAFECLLKFLLRLLSFGDIAGYTHNAHHFLIFISDK
jgi:hypothetical protein